MVKSIKPKDVKVGPDVLKQQIKDAVSKGKKAQAVKYDEQEAKEISAGKLKAKLQRQQKYRQTVLARMYKGEEYEIYLNQYNNEITMQWNGITYPKKLLGIDSLIVYNQYVNLCTEEKYLFEALKNDGLSEEQIEEIRNGGKYFKEAKDFKESIEDD